MVQKNNLQIKKIIIVNLLISSLTLFYQNSTLAQLIPDGTLGNESSIVIPNMVINGINSEKITGGALRGSNLFHSFQEFNINTGRGAYINNPVGIDNILIRVTGNNPAHIQGTLGVLGNANLFLIDPKGIIFSPTAHLNIGGSFLATTANAVRLSDGNLFSAVNPQSVPLLTISAPIGLQFAGNSATISVEGTGDNLIVNSLFAPINKKSNLTGLQVNPGKTLALVGGNISLDGSSLTAPSGKIELGSVAQGEVSLTPNTSGWHFNYQNGTTFQNIQLSQQALLDASGFSGGSINVQGKNLFVQDGSVILIQNKGLIPAGNININASESIQLSGTNPEGNIASTLLNETMGVGNGGNINIFTPQLSMGVGTLITTKTFSSARSGNIDVNVANSINIMGFLPKYHLFNGIDVLSFGSGSTGDITVASGELRIFNGGTIAASARASGSAGNVTVNNANLLELNGIELTTFTPSTIGSATFNAGNAGNLTVNTSELVVKNGARIDSSTFATGKAGSLIINASKSVEVSGMVVGSLNPTAIISAANIININIQKSLGLPPVPTGASGDVIINTPILKVTDDALISVKNDGPGNAGTLRINANSLILDHQGSITAATASGEGGNIIMKLSDLLLMRHKSEISATANGTGNGGNITINTTFLSTVAQENSDIIANAFHGKGGNISIASQGLFGIKFRPSLTAQSDITASSQFGVNGVVEINTPGTDPDQGVITLPSKVTDPSKLVSQTCKKQKNNTFMMTGRGGLPTNPTEMLNNEYVLISEDLPEEHSHLSRNQHHNNLTSMVTPTLKLVEAQGWFINEKNQIVLTEKLSTSTEHNSGVNLVSCNS